MADPTDQKPIVVEPIEAPAISDLPLCAKAMSL